MQPLSRVIAGIIATSMIATVAAPACKAIGLRGMALGGTNVAIIDGIDGAFGNPATLDTKDGKLVYFAGSISNWNLGTNDALMSYSEGKSNKMSGALSVCFDSNRDGNPRASEYSYKHGLISYTLAGNLARGLVVGASLKYEMLLERGADEVYAIRTRQGQGLGVNAGVLASVGKVNLGISAHDVGLTKIKMSDGSSYNYGTSVNTGISIEPIKGLLVAADISDITTLWYGINPEGALFRTGIEYSCDVKDANLSARLGRMRSIRGADSCYTGGIGFRTSKGLRLDYVYSRRIVNQNPTGIHMLGLGCAF